MYKRNIELPSLNHCCRGNAMSVTYSERVSVPLITQHAKRMFRFVICGLSDSNIFPHYAINGMIFRKNLLNTKCAF